MFKMWSFTLHIHTESGPRMGSWLRSYGNWKFSQLKSNKLDTKFPLAKLAAPDIRPGFELKPQKK